MAYHVAAVERSRSPLLGLLPFAAYYGLVFTLSLYLQRVRHLSAFVAGLSFLPSAVPILLLPVVAGRPANRVGARRVATPGLLLGTLGALGLLTIGVDSGPAPLAVMMLALGCGVGLTVGPQITLVIGAAPAAQSGIASGLLNAGRQTGYVLGVAVLGSMAANDDRVTGLHVAALSAAGLLVVALLVVALLVVALLVVALASTVRRSTRPQNSART